MPRRRAARAVASLLAAVVLAAWGCRGIRPGAAAPPVVRQHLAALLINGGRDAGANFWSHLHHLRAMRDLLLHSGVPADRIWVLASDGEDPAADLSLRRPVDPGDDGWILGGGQLDRLLGAKTEQVSSRIPGVRLGRADRAGVAAWFAEVGPTLRRGDTLLLFVTDHGTKNREHPDDNRIVLWGPNETLSVRELRALIDAHLAPGVRVLAIMSQCFSGSFAHLAALDPTMETARPVCGYFSTTATRPAYGCYPEAAEQDDRGHAIRMAEALGRLGALPVAHEATLVWDDTPDVPLRSSDVFLDEQLRDAAARAGRPVDVVADEELERALADPGRWEHELRLLDDIAAHYGLFSPRRVAELDARSDALAALADTFGRQRGAWRATLASAANANVARWLDAEGDAWRSRLVPAALEGLDVTGRAALRTGVLEDLTRYTRAEDGTWKRLERLREMTDRADGVTYRTQIRLGVLLRMRRLLLRIAGRSLVSREGSPAVERRLGELVACETLQLTPRPKARRDVPPPAPPLPAFHDDEAMARTFLPSWLGVKFQPPPEALATTADLLPGAAFVAGVFDGSAAGAAGIAPGDVILGPPGAPFREPNQLREWTMLQARGEPAPLRLLRNGRPLDVSVRLEPFPAEFPSLPAPPDAGDPAPPLSVAPYRGTPPRSLATGRPTLLFFWATWCAYCKASLPAVERLAHDRGVDVVAISDETPELLDHFFATHRGYFPHTVVRDPVRATFLAYGVNGMPTFVLVRPDGRIERVARGFDRAKGLPF